jgi:hypothetical protein
MQKVAFTVLLFVAACGESSSSPPATNGAGGSAGSGGSTAAGSGGTTQAAGSGGATAAGSGGSTTAGAGGTTQAAGGQGGAAGNGGSAGSGGAPGSGGTTVVGVPAGAPVVFYTDLASAPPGAFVTLWGRGFGAAQGTSTVTITGAPVAAVVSWSDTMIETRLPNTTAAGNLVVTTSAGASPPLALGSHAGTIYYVASGGNDTWSGTLDAPAAADGPFKTITKGRSALKAGDVLYIRTGTFTAEDNYKAVLSLRDVPTGTSVKPVAIVAYPGEKVVFGDNTMQRSFSLYRGDAGPNLDYLTIAKLDLRPSCDGVEVIQADHGRLVGNEVHGAKDACMNGIVEAQGSSDWKILGNYIHDNGNTKLEHGVYLGGYGTQRNWEIAYNRIGAQKGGRAIQLYGHTAGDRIENVSIHDNDISGVDRDGIVLGATDADVLNLANITIYNNLFHQAGRCVGHGVRIGNNTATGVRIVHNTFYDNGSGSVACDQSTGQVGGQVLVEAAVAVEIKNNILVSKGTEKYVDLAATPATFDGGYNLFFGNGAPPSWDGHAKSGDPLFAATAAGDFHVAKTSPAIAAGIAAGVSVDHDGVARPATPALGAYEAN